MLATTGTPSQAMARPFRRHRGREEKKKLSRKKSSLQKNEERNMMSLSLSSVCLLRRSGCRFPARVCALHLMVKVRWLPSFLGVAPVCPGARAFIPRALAWVLLCVCSPRRSWLLRRHGFACRQLARADSRSTIPSACLSVALLCVPNVAGSFLLLRFPRFFSFRAPAPGIAQA
jgi:hypothetical protein